MQQKCRYSNDIRKTKQNAIQKASERRMSTLHMQTRPGIAPTIVIMLILRIGSLMNVGYEKIILLYNYSTDETANVISLFVYRKGILQADYNYSTALELFNGVMLLP